MKKKIQALITEVARALYRDPKLKPKVSIDLRGSHVSIEIDASPYNPGLLIGERGSMKFAVQLLVGYALDVDPESSVSIGVSSSKKIEIDRTEPQPADAAKIRPVAEAIADLLGGSVKVEAAETSAMAIFVLPPALANDVKPPLSKVIRACGKASGFSALPYVRTK